MLAICQQPTGLETQTVALWVLSRLGGMANSVKQTVVLRFYSATMNGSSTRAQQKMTGTESVTWIHSLVVIDDAAMKGKHLQWRIHTPSVPTPHVEFLFFLSNSRLNLTLHQKKRHPAKTNTCSHSSVIQILEPTVAELSCCISLLYMDHKFIDLDQCSLCSQA